MGIGWDGLGRLNTVTTSSGATQTTAYWPSGMRAQTLDTGNTANNRHYAYTSGGLLLGEYVQVSQRWLEATPELTAEDLLAALDREAEEEDDT